MALLFVCYALIGIFGGICAGLLGIGGGVIVIPALLLTFKTFGLYSLNEMHVAVATTLSSMIFTTLSSFIAHHRKKAIYWSTVKQMLFGVVIGSILGALVSNWIPNTILKLIFGVFLTFAGSRLFFSRKENVETDSYHKPKALILNLISFAISFFGALLGVAGGVFSVPTFSALKMPFRNAIASSAALSFFITLFASICFFLIGFKASGDATSLVSINAFIIISVFSVCFAQLGAKLTHFVKVQIVKKVFSFLLVLIGLYMFFSAL